MPEEEKGFETIVDKMVDLVTSKGAMSLRDVAKALGVKEAQAEGIANVLSESGLLKVRYSLTGTFIEPRAIPEELRAKQLAALKTREGFQKLIAQVGNELIDTRQSFHFIEEQMVKRLSKAQELIQAIEHDERGASEEELAYLLKEARTLETEASAFGDEIKDLREKLNEFTEKVLEFEARTGEMEQGGSLEEPANVEERAAKPVKKKGLFDALFGWLRRK